MQISTNQVLKVLYILSWILFIGLAMEAGGFIFNAFFTPVINSNPAQFFWNHLDLSGLYQYDHGYFYVETFIMSIIAVMKAWIFYLVIRILHNQKFNLSRPFNREMVRFNFSVSYLAFLIGLFSEWGAGYCGWFIKQGVKMPDIQSLGLGGGSVWLLMSVTLFVIAQIFKKGIEIQTENDLTV